MENKDLIPDLSGIDSPETKQSNIMSWLDDLNETIEKEQGKKKKKKKKSTRQSKACQQLNESLYQRSLYSFIEKSIQNHSYTRQGKPIPEKQLKAIKDQALRVTVKPKHHENGAGDVEKCIIAYIGMIPKGFAVKIGVKGTKRTNDKGEEVMTATGDTKGVSDVIALIDGRMICIEVKYSPRDVQGPKQIKFEDNVNRCGGTYIIVKNFTDFLPRFREWFNNEILNKSK